MLFFPLRATFFKALIASFIASIAKVDEGNEGEDVREQWGKMMLAIDKEVI